MPLTPGTRLGPYEILSPVGTGGMGEVYRARDERLGRDVALKVLPSDVASDPVRRQRFEREARAVAALNHPNVLAIYDVGDQDGVLYMVTELVDGQTLRDADFSLRRAVDCAAQIATGLAAAHAAGVVHRDLKPENILLTRDGRIKILDFGLAKRAAVPGGGGDTLTLPATTDPGVVLGTVGYMSPEQVKGIDADHRSDIFSFGLILYELLGGRRAFRHETAVETMRAILREDPSELPDTVPPALRQIVAHCLEKDPGNRFQSAQDLAFALTALPQPSMISGSVVALPEPKPIRRMIAARVLSALVLVALTATTAWFIFSAAPESPSWSAAILGGPEMALDPRVSPDSHLIAFQAFDRGLNQVAVMKPETGNWSILTHDRSHGVISNIAWSSDGALIYYDRSTNTPQGVYSVPVLGGEERLVVENAWRPETLPDGSLLVGKVNARRQLQLVRLQPQTGGSQELPVVMAGSPANTSNNTPISAFPDGKRAAIYAAGAGSEGFRLLAIDIATGAAKPLLPAGENGTPTAWAVTRDGKNVVAAVTAGSLTRIVSYAVDAKTPEHTLFTTNSQVWYLDADADGSVYASITDRPTELVRRSLTDDNAERIASFPQLATDLIAQLPDGRVVVTGLYAGGARLMAIEKGKQAVPLINSPEQTGPPLTAVGANEVAFMIGPEPRATIALADATTGVISRKISPGKGVIKSLASSPDGRNLYFAAGGAVWSIPATAGEPRQIRAGDSVAADPSGRFLAVSIIENGTFKLYRVMLNGDAEQEIVINGSDPLMDLGLSTNSLSGDGRLLAPLQPRDSWFNAPALLDLAAGRLTRLSSDNLSDYHSMAWASTTEMVALRVGLRSTLWRFKPSAPRR